MQQNSNLKHKTEPIVTNCFRLNNNQSIWPMILDEDYLTVIKMYKFNGTKKYLFEPCVCRDVCYKIQR